MKVYRILALAAFPLTALSCSTKLSGDTDLAGGRVNFTVENDCDVTVVTKSSVSDYTALPEASDFNITVKDSDGVSVYDGAVSGWDSSKSLQTGDYSVTATCGEEGSEGFGKPYFTGSKDFTVTGGQTTSVTVPVKLGNSIVKISCSENFRNYFTDWSFSIKTGSGTTVDFPKTETRAAFIEAYRFSISGSFTSQGGKVTRFEKEYSSIEANTCYTISFDASNIGGLKVSVNFDDTVETIDCGDIELND